MHRSSVLLAVFISILAARPGVAQQKSIPQISSPNTFHSETHMVVVDAVVTDDDGNHIKDLSERDFSIREDGKPQSIASFSFEDGTDDDHGSHPLLRPNVYTNRPEYRGAGGPLVVFLLDQINASLQSQVYLRDQVADYFRRNTLPHGQYAIYVLGHSLTVAQDFTSDKSLLLKATEKFEPKMPFLLEMGGEQSDMQDIVWAVESQERAQEGLAALRLVARTLAKHKGRKILIWLSGSFPTSLMEPLQFAAAYWPLAYGNEVRMTTNLLSEAEVAVYPIDVRGLVAPEVIDARHRVIDWHAEYALQAKMEEDRYTMELLASETGGRVWKNRNDLEYAVEQSVADNAGYYSLAYYPSNKKWNRKFREIEVRVARSGLHVLAPRGYYAVSPTKRDKKWEEREFMALLLAGGPQESSVVFDAKVVPSRTASGLQIAIDVLVDPSGIQPQEASETKVYTLEWHAIVIANDKKRHIPAHLDQKVTATASEAAVPALQRKGMPLHGALSVAPGDYVLHLGVRDLLGGKYGTLEVPLALAGP